MNINYSPKKIYVALGILALFTTVIIVNKISKKPASQTMINHNEMNHSMDLGPADANYDLRFIDGMIPHHEGAVIMAQDLAEKTQRPELQTLAKNIIYAQEKEIEQMKQWRKQWYPNAMTTPMAWHGEMNHMMVMSTQQIEAMKMNVNLGSADVEYDLRFLEAMIPHHEAAVIMAKDLAEKTQRPELQKIAQDILASQQAEIDQMKQWRQQWYKK
jgi:uncharacterized protein (DUF305 family)